MRVVVSTDSEEQIALDGGDDFTALDVVGEKTDLDQLDNVLRRAGVGRSDGHHAYLEIDWLRQAANIEETGQAAKFDAMVAYADRNGWVDSEARTVRAHVIWEGR